MDQIIQKVLDFGRNILKWTKSLTKSKRQALLMGAGVITFAALAGGPLLQYAFGGILINSLFWMLVTDSPRMLAFMKKYGAGIDIILTIGSFFTGGGTLGGWLTNLMGTGFFTLFRKYFAEETGDDGQTWIDRAAERIGNFVDNINSQEMEPCHG